MDSFGKRLFSLAMWKQLIVLALATSSAFAQEQYGTAYDALRVISGRLGKPALNHVVSINGVEGDPQPARWKVVLEDSQSPTGTREVEVAGDQIVSDRPSDRAVIGSAHNSTIKTSRLNLDSSGAFSVASRVADRSAARFATANYTLRVDEHGDPIWIVTLIGPNRNPVGTIHINCNRGNVVRTEGMFAGATMNDVVEAPVERRHVEHHREEVVANNDNDNDGDDDDNERGPLYPVKQSVKNAFFRTQEQARGMWDNVRRSFDDFISRH